MQLLPEHHELLLNLLRRVDVTGTQLPTYASIYAVSRGISNTLTQEAAEEIESLLHAVCRGQLSVSGCCAAATLDLLHRMEEEKIEDEPETQEEPELEPASAQF